MASAVTVEKLEVISKRDIKEAILKIMSDLDVSISGKHILLKPNFVCPRPCATTNMELVRSMIEILSSKNQLVLAEGSGYEFDTEKTFEILGVWELGKEYGVPVVNLRKEQTRKVKIGGKVLKYAHIPGIVCDVDGIVNMPKLKTHALTAFTFAMKNLFGLLSDDSRRKAHVWGLNQAIVDLTKYFAGKNLLTIGDGLTVMGGEGPAFGDIVELNLLFGGTDNCIIDRMAAGLVGFSSEDIKYVRLAFEQGILNQTVDYRLKEETVDLPKSKASSFYHSIYWCVYAFDSVVSSFTKKSLIPQIITKFGTQVEINKEKCTGCNQCIRVCPVGAISKDWTIDFDKCRYVRCFRCYDVCPTGAIRVQGHSKPQSRGRNV